jgi:hypothetical protein
MKSNKQSNINSKRIQNQLSKIHPSVTIITAYDINLFRDNFGLYSTERDIP